MPPQRIAAVVCHSVPQQPCCRRRIATTAAATLTLRCCHNVAATAVLLPSRSRIVARCRHSSRLTAIVSLTQQPRRCSPLVAAAAVLLPQQLRRCRHVVATAAVPQQPRRVVATAAVMLPSRCCRSVAATAALLPLHCCIVAHRRRSSHVATPAAPLPAQHLGCYGCFLPQQLRCHHISPIAATASAALPQPQPPLPMPLPPTPLRCAPMQTRLRCRCHLCHL
jgi:hypothetical protein